MMADEPNTETETARFLAWLRPPESAFPGVTLTTIRLVGGTTTKTHLDAQAGVDWIRRFVGQQNCYYMVNPPRGALSKKAAKSEVAAVALLHVDIDPAKGADWQTERWRILSSLEDYQPRPSAVIDSGNGYQALWRLRDPEPLSGSEDWARLEAYNRQLALDLHGDSTHDVSRILRLPGPPNLPDETKRARGRVERSTSIIWMEDSAYDLKCFTPVPESVSKARTASPVVVELPADILPADLDALPNAVDERVRMLIVQGDDPDDPTRYSSKSEAMWAVVCALVRAGCSNEQMAAVLLDRDLGISDHPLRQKRPLEYVARQIERAINAVATEGEVRPRIVWSEVELARCLDEAEAALIQSGLPIYQMGDRLVQAVTVPCASNDEGSVRRAAGSLVIAPLPKHRLHELFLSTARFLKISRDKDGNAREAPFAPPLQFAETYIARRGAWRLPVLSGIATTPTMRSDGSVVSDDGYDPASGLIIDTQGVAFPPVAEAPSKELGRAALDALIDVISEFPFVCDDEDGQPGGDRPSQSRSAALAMIITAVARPMFGAAPMFGISAPIMASGKSLMADVPAMIVTGRRATKMSQGASEEEDEKRLLSVLMHGDRVNVIDNITRPIEGDALCTILTEETWRCRLLGRSEMRDVGTQALFIATGNNLSFRNDMASRAVLARIDPELENPGERIFRLDLKTYVPKHRARLAVATLTVLRAYIAAGRPKMPGMVASRFDDWAVVRAALIWLGEPDPWDTNARVAVGDEARAEHHDLMLAIGAAFGFGEFLSTTEIIKRAEGTDEVADSLNLALATALPHGVSASGLGRFLNKVSDRRVDGVWIKASPSKKKGGRYAIMWKDAVAPRGAHGGGAEAELFRQAGARSSGAQGGNDVPF